MSGWRRGKVEDGTGRGLGVGVERKSEKEGERLAEGRKE